MPDFKISASLEGHGDDVRTSPTMTPATLVTAKGDPHVFQLLTLALILNFRFAPWPIRIQM